MSFFRSVGGSVGVAVFGALFTSGLTRGLAHDLPAQVASKLAAAGGGSLPDVHTLPAAQQAAYQNAFATALTSVFRVAVPIMVAAFLLVWLLKEVPLGGRIHTGTDTSRELSAGSAPGTAEPDSVGVGA